MRSISHAFIISGTNSGCGKTTATMGLMSLLKKASLNVAPFKTGPDYIDPRFHEKVLGTPSYNLDTFLLSSQTVNFLFNKHTQNKDIAIVEGVMGMYDGIGKKAGGSTYELAKTLNIPVVLVVGCKALYQSVAAIVKGFSELKPDANVKGVILNHVSSNDHYSFLKETIEEQCNVKCVGYIPPMNDIKLESRHLGLIQANEVDSLHVKIEYLTSILESTIDINALLEISAYKPNKFNPYISHFANDELKGINLGVAYDEAFSFYYKDNLELLEECGAKLHFFSPVADSQLPQTCNAFYFGGGYPEVFADALSNNTSMIASIKHSAEKGIPIFAECGGLMYLTNEIIQKNGLKNKMAGVFNCSVQMTERLKRFGYAELSYNETKTRCHEFHCSEIVNNDNSILETYSLSKPDNNKHWSCGLKYKNTLAGYAHIHFWSEPEFTKQIFKLWKEAIM